MAVSAAERRYVLEQLARLAEGDLSVLWNAAKLLATNEFRAYMMSGFTDIAGMYNQMAGQLAASWFEDSDPLSDYVAAVADPPPQERLEKSAQWGLRGDGEQGLARMNGSMQRAVFDGARDTIETNVKATGSRFIRVARPNACPFCKMLATRAGKYAYTSAQVKINPETGRPYADGRLTTVSGGRSSKKLDSEYHDHCYCTAVEIRSGQTESDVLTADEQRLLARWNEQYDKAVANAGTTDVKSVMSAWRETEPARDRVERRAFRQVRDTGGVTINLSGDSPVDGFAFAPFKTTEFKVAQSEFTPEHIDRYIEGHAAELAQPGNHLGMWTQGGDIYIDISRVGAADVDTLARAQKANQLAVYDLKSNTEIQLGTIDGSGRYTAVGSPADILAQHRRQVGGADERRSSLGLPDVGGGRTAEAVAPRPAPPVSESVKAFTERFPRVRVQFGEDDDPAMVADFLAGISEVLKDHPTTTVRAAGSPALTDIRASSAMPKSTLGWCGQHGETSYIEFNRAWLLDPEGFDKEARKRVAAGYYPALGGRSPAFQAGVHEAAHGFDAHNGFAASSAAERELRAVWERDHPFVPKLKDNGEFYDEFDWDDDYYYWLHTQLPQYSFVGSKQELKPREAVASAVADVACNGDDALEGSQVLNDLWNRRGKPELPSSVPDGLDELRLPPVEELEEAHAAIEKAKVERDKFEARKAKGTRGKPDSEEERTRAAMDPDRIRRNREALWEEVTEPVRTQGKMWYPDDGSNMVEIHKGAGSPLDGDPLAELKVKAMGAAYSPQVDWDAAKIDVQTHLLNIDKPYKERVDAFVAARGGMHYTENLRRADRVIAARTPEEIDLALRGSANATSHYFDNAQKIRHFYPNLRGGPGDYDLLTCDTWDSRGARLHPDERRALINADLLARNAAKKKPLPEDKVKLYSKGEQVPWNLVQRADKLADEANAAARAAGEPEPYMPSAPLMVKHGYDIIESATVEALPEGFDMASYQAGTWVWLRGSA